MYIMLSKKAGAEDNSETTLRLSLFPNPATVEVKAPFTLNRQRKVVIQITSLNGKVLQQTSSQLLPAGKYTSGFNIENFSSGSYVLKIQSGNTIQ